MPIIKKTMINLPSCYSDLASSKFFLSLDLKRMLTGKKFTDNEEIIAEKGAYFEIKDKSYHKHFTDELKDHRNRWISFDGNYST